MDGQMAEIVLSGTRSELITLVDLRTCFPDAPPIWRNYWDPEGESLREFGEGVGLAGRLKRILAGGTEIVEVKEDISGSYVRVTSSTWIIGVASRKSLREKTRLDQPPGKLSSEKRHTRRHPAGEREIAPRGAIASCTSSQLRARSREGRRAPS
jgi:hypothetical protein